MPQYIPETAPRPDRRCRGPVIVLLAVLVGFLAAEARAEAPSSEPMTRSQAGASAETGPARPPVARGPAISVAENGPERKKRLPDVFQGMMVPGLVRDSDCTPPAQIRRRLKRQGWWDFDRLERAGDTFHVRARRPNGTAYQLTIEGCSGRVLGAKRLSGAERGYRLWPR